MDKKLLFALIMSIGTLLLFNYFNKNKQIENRNQIVLPENLTAGQSYSVPSRQDLARPINLEVDFLDKKITKKEEIKNIETDLCSFSFSNYGGVVASVQFKKHKGKNNIPLKTIQRKTFYEREQSAFLLALEEKTPYFYNLDDYKKALDLTKISYKAVVNGWEIKKIYTIYNDSYKIDLDLEFLPTLKSKETIRPRIFIPAPFIGELGDDVQNGVVLSQDGKSVDVISQNNLNRAWIMPDIFGAQDKYFVHTLINDRNKFVQRSFYKREESRLFPILEGPNIEKAEKWHLSFYLGPKLINDLLSVDERLEGVLSFGWLSWLCKLLLRLLAWLYSFLGNFGLAIIILAILLKIPFVPLTISGRKRMEEYQKYQPTINRIRQKYKKDIQMQQAEIIKFHKEHGISPTAPMLGCLPLLIQMPFIFALYRMLNNYLGLYQAPFFAWITDLSAKDPYYVLPIIMGLSMFLQQKIAPVADGKQNVAMKFFPLILIAVFINFPAGLVLYWLTNNVLTILEDFLRKKYYK